MSTSSNTSNSGPNRFRSDAASFSPSVPSPGVMNQQMQQQQQHIYPQYMYGTPQMIPNQYYPYMAPYVMHPSAPQTEFNPYTQGYGAYPMQIPQYPGLPYPGMPNINGGNMNMNTMMNNRPKIHNNKSKQYLSHSDKSRSSSSVSSNVPHPYQNQQTPPAVHLQEQSKHDHKTDKAHEGNIQLDQLRQETQTSTETNDKPNEQANIHDKKESTSNAKEQDKYPSKSPNNPTFYPLYFNENPQDFIKSQHSITSERKELVNQKNDRSDEFIRSEGNEKQGLIINRNSNVTIVDYNTNTTHETIENNNYNAHASNESDHNDDSNEGEREAGDSTDKTRGHKPPNWASFLQTTATVPSKKAKSQPKSSQEQTATHISAPSSFSSVITTANATHANNILTLDSSQPLGIVLLKVMFDNNYSVMNSHNQCPIFRVKPRGLTNTGNICYMNAILQVLLYCEPFNKTLKLIESKSIGTLSQISTTPLLDIVIKIWKEFTQQISMKPISPDSFYMSLITHEKFSHLKWGQQEDAEEFLGYFLDGLHEEFVGSIKGLNTPQTDLLIQQFQQQNENLDQPKFNEFKANIKNTMKIIKKSKSDSQETSHLEETNSDQENNGWSEVGSNNKKISAKRTVEIEPSPITTIFGGQFRSVLQIPKNKESQSITLDPFQCIQLDISDPSITTIEEAFKQLNEPEKIPYKSSCNKEVIAKKQTFIDQLPNILIIHLKRFSYQQEKEKESTPSNESSISLSNGTRSLGSIEKLRKKIEYSHYLTIPNEVLSPLYKHGGKNSNHYKLFGVVYHHGVSAEGGHYTSDVLRKSSVFDNEEESNDKKVDNQWIRIDDTQITDLEKEEVLNGGDEETTKNAYILFYQKT